jgi:hypothetical protein
MPAPTPIDTSPAIQGDLRQPAPRMLFIDNLRWSMIILVIGMHAADTYSPMGNWYFTDRTPLSRPVLLTFAAWQMYLQVNPRTLHYHMRAAFLLQPLPHPHQLCWNRTKLPHFRRGVLRGRPRHRAHGQHLHAHINGRTPFDYR